MSTATLGLTDRQAAFLAAMDAVPAGDGRWRARCPAHDDRTPSLGIGLDDKGLWAKCHAGCEYRHILRAAGFAPTELFFDHDARAAEKPEPAPKRKPVKAYDYRNESGALLYQKLRYDPKGFGCRRPCPGEGCTHPGCTRPRDGWHWMLSDVRRVLYRLPELLAAPPSVPALVVEGEKDADAAAGLGFLATTNVEGGSAGEGGGHRWRDEYSRALRARRVAVIPDNDPQGLRHADGIVGSLVRHGCPEVRVVILPGAGVKDLSDWIAGASGGEPRRELAAIIKQVPGR